MQPQAEALVGREREQQHLRDLLADARTGRGRLVLISGEAGIGKTTLVDDLVHEAKQRDCLVLSGGCYDLTTTPPYGPWIEVFRSQADMEELPSWPGTGAANKRTSGQTELFDEIRQLLQGLAACRPLVIVLEDLHWADQASLELLRHLGRGLDDDRMLIVATFRDPEISRGHPLFRLLPPIISESRPIRLELRPLDIDALEDLLQSAYGLPANRQSRLAKTLLERTDGNPLFVREVLRTMEHQGDPSNREIPAGNSETLR
ncbi:MAG: AAA family ATPase [Thermomicrobiales bacterium]